MKTLTHKILMAIAPRIIWGYLRFTILTSRLRIYGSGHPDRLIETGSGFIYAFWHNRQIILPVIRKHGDIHCLISSSRDGEYIARVVALFGKASIRGSSTRGGLEAMKQMMRILESGGIVAMTPDGPLGPAREVKPGVIQLSRAFHCPIIPIGFDSSRKKVFNSWDKFNLPYPFTRIAIVFGEPLTIGQSESDEDGCYRLKQSLDRVISEATENMVR